MATLSQPSENTTAFRKLRKKLRRNVGRAIEDFAMIEQGDKVMVCLSGGKDSYTLLDILLQLRDRAPVSFDILAVHLDQKQPGYDARILPDYLSTLDIEWHIIEKDTYSIVIDKIPAGKTMCSLCSRLRRGTLYGFAEKNGISKIALGHHRDDMIETLFLNMFHQGSLKSMPPKLQSDDAKNIVIRPLAYCEERDIEKYARARAFPIIPCNLCGSQENLERQNIKAMLRQWQHQYPRRIDSIFASLSNVAPSQLSDRSLYDFNRINNNGPSDIKWLPEVNRQNEMTTATPTDQNTNIKVTINPTRYD